MKTTADSDRLQTLIVKIWLPMDRVTLRRREVAM